jgi:hypothetical protein
MPRAYIRIWVEGGRETAVRNALLQAQPAIRAADITSGDQDLIVCAEVDGLDRLFEFVSAHIRSIAGVKRTETNLVLEPSGAAGSAAPVPSAAGASAPARTGAPRLGEFASSEPVVEAQPAAKAIAAANKLKGLKRPAA